MLNSKLKNFTSWVEKEASKIIGEQQEDFYEFYADDYNRLSKIFPNILRSSLFIMYYALLENELVNLCKNLYKHYNYSIKLTDFQGKGIFRVQTYLKKVAKIDFPDQTSSWDDIVSYNHIRNFIIHNGGRLDNSNRGKEVESFITDRPSMNLDHLKNIQFSKDFCPEVIGTLKSFFGDLFKTLP
ncbi:unnamed protein product [marine sediment metagenome]|uniref:RiboL-PSP-HEPN domain-containing protein n=1 Tax=marine sediment metagenome TaxID=412755 RepID=X0ZIU6_9ZZZZ